MDLIRKGKLLLAQLLLIITQRTQPVLNCRPNVCIDPYSHGNNSFPTLDVFYIQDKRDKDNITEYNQFGSAD